MTSANAPKTTRSSSYVGREDRWARASSTLLILLVSLPIADGMISRLVDRTVYVYDRYGRLLFMSPSSSAGTGLRLLLHLAMIALAAYIIFVGWRQRHAYVSFFTGYAALAWALEMLRGGGDMGDMVKVSTSFLVIIAAGFARITRHGIRRLALTILAMAIATLVYSLSEPIDAWRECRIDKCSPAGKLLTGFFSHENVVARGMSVLLPAFAYIERNWIRRTGLVLTFVLTVLSGSRGALPSLALTLVCYLLLRHLRVSRQEPDSTDTALGSSSSNTNPRGGWILISTGLAWAPLLFFIASTAFLVTLAPGELTGRGDVYALVRQSWNEMPLLGQGHTFFRHFYEAGQIGFLPQHEHGQAPYDINGTGSIGWALMAAGLFQCALRNRSGSQIQVVSLTASLTPIFVTEPVMTVGSGGVIWPLFLLAMLAAQPRFQPDHHVVSGGRSRDTGATPLLGGTRRKLVGYNWHRSPFGQRPLICTNRQEDATDQFR